LNCLAVDNQKPKCSAYREAQESYISRKDAKPVSAVCKISLAVREITHQQQRKLRRDEIFIATPAQITQALSGATPDI
jgi:hypothetical protein